MNKEDVYNNTKKYLILAVRELKILKCECNKDMICDRCLSIMNINASNNYISQFVGE